MQSESITSANFTNASGTSPTALLPAGAGASMGTDGHDVALGFITPAQLNGNGSPQGTLPSSSVTEIDADDDIPQVYPTEKGRCLVAELALLKIDSEEADVRKTLATFGYTGAYLFRVGFEEDLLSSKQGYLQQISLHLESDLHPACAEKIAQCLGPYPLMIHALNQTYRYPLSYSDMWTTWGSLGILMEVGNQAASNPSGESLANSAGPSAGGDAGARGCASGKAGNLGTRNGGQTGKDKSKDKNKERDRDEDEDEGSSQGEDEGSGQGEGDRLQEPEYQYSDCNIHIPFISDITTEGKPSTTYQSNGVVKINISNNADGQTPPSCGISPDMPWLKASFESLSTEIYTDPCGKPNYSFNQSDVFMTVMGCKAYVTDRYPIVIDPQDDNVKSVADNKVSGSINTNIAPVPSLEFGASITRGSSAERLETQWAVESKLRTLKSKGVEPPPKMVWWKYTENNKLTGTTTSKSLKPTPCATFSMKTYSVTTPEIRIKLMMDYKSSIGPRTLRQKFTNTSRSKPISGVPVFSNFVHEVLIELKFPEQAEHTWTADLCAHDFRKESDVKQRTKSRTKLENRKITSNSTVLFERALQGYIEERGIEAGDDRSEGPSGTHGPGSPSSPIQKEGQAYKKGDSLQSSGAKGTQHQD